MLKTIPPSQFWVRWLVIAAIGVMGFGLMLVMAPTLAREGFSLLLFNDTNRVASFGVAPTRYIELLHAVLGAVMFGWGLALLLVVRGLFARGVREGWQIITISVLAWFIPDTAFSIWSGFWQNAVLNLVFIVLFATPLTATFRNFYTAATKENPS
jgi:hypothetical protein